MKIIRYVGLRSLSVPATRRIWNQLLRRQLLIPFPRAKRSHLTLNGMVGVQISLREHVRDFLDVAVTVYIADELNGRDHSDDRWTRDLDIIFP
jgi:hypothetical protein